MESQNEKKLLSLTNDYVFRRIFAEKNISALAEFLASVLGMPADELGELIIDDPHINRERDDGKSNILDILAHTKCGEIYHVEVQVEPGDAFGERIAYLNSRIFSGQLNIGDSYKRLNRTISVIIANRDFLKGNGDCINRFRWYNLDNGSLLTDAQEINTLELAKLPAADDGTELWKWLKLLKSGRKEEMEELAREN